MGRAALRRLAVAAVLAVAAAAAWWLLRGESPPSAADLAGADRPAGNANPTGVAAPRPGADAEPASPRLAATRPGPASAARSAGVEVTVERLAEGKRSPADGVLVTASAPDDRGHWHTFFEGRTLPDGRLHVPAPAGPVEVMVVERGSLGDSARAKAPASGGPPAAVTLTLRRLATL